MSDIIRFIRANVELDDYSFDAYELPNGERRVGFAKVSTILGYEKDWVGALARKGKKQLEAMQEMGYTGLAVEGQIWEREQGGGGTVKTLSVPDFNKILGYETIEKGNRRAGVLLFAMSEVGIERTIELAFAGKSMERILSKIVHYSRWTPEEFMQVMAENREELSRLRFGLGGK